MNNLVNQYKTCIYKKYVDIFHSFVASGYTTIFCFKDKNALIGFLKFLDVLNIKWSNTFPATDYAHRNLIHEAGNLDLNYLYCSTWTNLRLTYGEADPDRMGNVETYMVTNELINALESNKDSLIKQYRKEE